MAPSWSELASSLSSKQTEEERTFRERLASGKSSTNALANLRLFDAPEGTEPTVTLYRDYAAWCPYCEKVWLQLEEKRIPYRVEKVNMRCYGSKPDWFMRMQPSGGIPVAKVNGVVITESNDIMQALEDDFPQHNPLIPEASNPHAPRVKNLLRLEREIFGSWFRWLCSNTRFNDSQQKNFEALMDRVDDQLREANDIAVANGAKEVNPRPKTMNHRQSILDPTPYTPHPDCKTMDPTPYALHPTPFTMHISPFTIHHTPYAIHHHSKTLTQTLNPKPCIPNPQSSILNPQP